MPGFHSVLPIDLSLQFAFSGVKEFITVVGRRRMQDTSQSVRVPTEDEGRHCSASLSSFTAQLRGNNNAPQKTLRGSPQISQLNFGMITSHTIFL